MFQLYQTDDGHELPFEYLPCSAITPKYGMAMVLTGGKLAIATGANKPQYVCAREEGGAVTTGTIIPAVKVDSDQRWRVANTASHTIGAAYTLASGGLDITTTTTDGVFTVDGIDADEGYVYGRFL